MGEWMTPSRAWCSMRASSYAPARRRRSTARGQGQLRRRGVGADEAAPAGERGQGCAPRRRRRRAGRPWWSPSSACLLPGVEELERVRCVRRPACAAWVCGADRLRGAPCVAGDGRGGQGARGDAPGPASRPSPSGPACARRSRSATASAISASPGGPGMPAADVVPCHLAERRGAGARCFQGTVIHLRRDRGPRSGRRRRGRSGSPAGCAARRRSADAAAGSAPARRRYGGRS